MMIDLYMIEDREILVRYIDSLLHTITLAISNGDTGEHVDDSLMLLKGLVGKLREGGIPESHKTRPTNGDEVEREKLVKNEH